MATKTFPQNSFVLETNGLILMTNFLKKYHISILLGLITLLLGYIIGITRVNVSSNIINKYGPIDSLYLGLKLDTSQFVKKKEVLDILKAQHVTLEQNEFKFEALNSRISDFYVSFGILVTLILIYLTFNHFSLKNVVKANLDENFGTYKDEIELMHSESSTLINRMRVNSVIIKPQSQIESEPTITPQNLNLDENDNGNN